jgi:hypothetical protein
VERFPSRRAAGTRPRSGWEDSRRYSIDRVTDVRRAASLKAGGIGIRYTCVVRGHETYLFFEERPLFMERKEREYVRTVSCRNGGEIAEYREINQRSQRAV